MSSAQAIRVRGHVPAGPPKPPKPWWEPSPDAPVLLVHGLVDDHDQLLLATSRELHTGPERAVTVGERLFLPAPAAPRLVASTTGLRPQVPAGLATSPVRVSPVDEMGKLISRRSYRSRWPLVGWDLPWTIGRVAAHAGHATGPADGFSLGLSGTGIYVTDRWSDSWDHPRLIVTPRDAGHSGAFFRWGAARQASARYRGRKPADFLDLQVLADALAGIDLADAAQACAAFGVDWPTPVLDPVVTLRGQTAALVQLYVTLVTALVEVAPGMAPRDVWSFGSIATYSLSRAGVTSPTYRAEHDPDN